MDFISFVKTSEKQDDPELAGFAAALKKISDVPLSSDPRILAKFLYKKLNHLQTRGFQKWFMIYFSVEPNNTVPKELRNNMAFLDAINTIIALQNKDPEYKDF